ncbi:UV excision repair protein RAD23 homolog B-like [Paramacrobiotus metropolitanus]|uniref:UV excision repair protein RAD23 homolog B-like n=1 Tax=Paramacrobiotus metropolitanus TaxID=2943436 RepID=UPI0024458753|nr:UV excision repair protein RAD23 homolog B-like [Paramacrobiotus metropolitanus]
MQITCRLLNQETFTVEAEGSCTVAEIKEKIQEKKGSDFKAESLKLISAGKVWDNNSATLSDLNYSPSGFVVVMIAKPKPQKAAVDVEKSVPSPAASVQSVESSASVSVIENPMATNTPESRPHAPSPASQQPRPRPEAAFGLSPEQYEALVNQVLQMGYPRAEVERALRAAFYNPERAIEYLLTGIPESAGGSSSSRAVMRESEDEPEDNSEDSRNRLTFFRNSPQFLQMRALLQQDPQLLPRFLQDIGQSNPALFQAIRDNQQEFLSMINSPLPGDGSLAENIGAANPSSGRAGATAGSTGAATAGVASAVRVNQEEREAIERLKQLGFPEAMVVEAYFACDKNEQHAANFLFAQMEEFEQSGSGAGTN